MNVKIVLKESFPVDKLRTSSNMRAIFFFKLNCNVQPINYDFPHIRFRYSH